MVDDSELPTGLKSIAHLDLKKLSINQATKQIAKKILLQRYTSNEVFLGINQSDDNFIARFCDVHDQKLINIFCHAIINSPTTEIRLATFTPLKLLGNMQFQVTLELLIDNMQKEMRDGTIRFYCISPTEKNVRPFVNFSREPKNALRNKLKKSKEMVQSLLEFSKLQRSW